MSHRHALLVIVSIVCLFFAPLFLPQPKIFFTPELIRSDIFYQNLPFKLAYQESLRSFALPLWESRIGGGFPLFAEGQTGSLFLPNLLLFGFLPLVWAWNLSYVVSILTAATGTYAFVVSKLKVNPAAGVLAAISFSLSGFISTHFIHLNAIQVISLFPWLLLVADKLWAKPQNKWVVLFAMLLSQQILAGSMQYTFISLVGVGLWLGGNYLSKFHKLSRLAPKLLVFCLAILLAGLLALPQLLATIEFASQAHRLGGTSSAFIFNFPYPLSHLSSFIFPYTSGTPKDASFFVRPTTEIGLYWENTGYVGLITLGLALIALKEEKKYRFHILLVGVISLLLVLGPATPLGMVYHLPLFNLFRMPSRFLVLVTFALALLAAYGTNQIKAKLSSPMFAGLIALAIADVWYFSSQQNPLVAWQTVQAPPALVQELNINNRVVTDESHHQLWMEYYLSKGWQDLEVYTYFRNGLSANSNILFGLTNMHAYTGARPLRQEVFFTTPVLIDFTDNLATHRITTSEATSREWILEASTSAQLTKPLPDYLLYRQHNPHPGYYLASAPTGVADMVQAQEMIEADPSRDLFVNPVIETLLAPTSASASGSIVQDKQTRNQTDFSIQVDAPAWFIWHQSFYPGWQARLNSKPVEVYPANINQQAVWLPQPGVYDLEFEFQPHWLLPTLIIWGSSQIIALTYLIQAFGLNHSLVNFIDKRS